MDAEKIKRLEDMKSTVDFYNHKSEIMKELKEKNDYEEPKDTEEFNQLLDIKGLGKETIDDLKAIYNGNFDKFLLDVKTKTGKDLPIRNDLAKKIRNYFATKDVEKLIKEE